MHLVCLSLFTWACTQGPPGNAVEDFELRDYRGATRHLSDWKDAKLTALVFLGVDCPLVNLYGPRLAELDRQFGTKGVQFVGINSNEKDAVTDIGRYAKTNQIPFPILKDPGNVIADRFGALRVMEVFLLDEKRVVRYHGRIDDQFTVSLHRLKPQHRDLAAAMEELLDGRAVRVPETEASGCLIDRVRVQPAKRSITYSKHVAPILQKHCQVCHRPGQIAPFALTSYKEAAGWAAVIDEVVGQGRMPPWHADPRHGRFANDPRLTDQEKQLVAAWARDGAPEGDPADQPPPPTFTAGWAIGKPDCVISIPEPFTVPAEGVIEYQFIEVDPGFTKDVWIQAAEIRPSNRAVAHHCNAFLQPPGSTRDFGAPGKLGSVCLTEMAPGTPPMVLPSGMAKRIPAGWKLVFVLHYTPIGMVQQDQTIIGLIFADAKTIKKEVATNLVLDENLNIPPHVADHRVEHTQRFDADVLLLALFPHMHVRGKSFRFEAEYLDGTTEVLLDVPRWDFAWQNRYVLAEPKRLPAGTVMHCVAVYDNSENNPANPDPDATVHTGSQSWEEMFNGYFEVVLADQDLTKPAGFSDLALATLRFLTHPAVVVLSLAAFLFVRFRRWHARRMAVKNVAKRG
jgi:peroxiredoxin